MNDGPAAYDGRRREEEERVVERKGITNVARNSVIAFGSCTRARLARRTS